MASSDSLSGIGFSPLGNVGLGLTGQYGSYDAYMPSMLGMGYGMGMNSSIFPMGGLYGMYNPGYMAKMYQDVEASQAIHTGNMHQILLDNEVRAHKETNTAAVKKMLTDSDIQQRMSTLYEKVITGDQDGICQEFDRLQNYVLNTYKAEFKASGNDPLTSATRHIEAVYSQMASVWAGDGRAHNLMDDIKYYGENSFKNGFMQGFKKGHNSRYVDETLNHCFGLRIQNKESKDLRQDLGNGIGRTASVLEKGAYGSAIAVGATGIALGLGKAFSFGKLPWLKCMGKAAPIAAVVGLGAGMLADIFWQVSKD